jgi:hypothetical protein
MLQSYFRLFYKKPKVGFLIDEFNKSKKMNLINLIKAKKSLNDSNQIISTRTLDLIAYEFLSYANLIFNPWAKNTSAIRL